MKQSTAYTNAAVPPHDGHTVTAHGARRRRLVFLVTIAVLIPVCGWRLQQLARQPAATDGSVDPRWLLRCYTRARRTFAPGDRTGVLPGHLYGRPILLAVQLARDPDAGYWPLVAMVTGADFLAAHRAEAAVELVRRYADRKEHLVRLFLGTSDQSFYDPRPMYQALLRESSLDDLLRAVICYSYAEWLARYQPRSVARDEQIRRLCQTALEHGAEKVRHPIFPPYTLADMASMLVREVDAVRPGKPAPSIRGVDLAGRKMSLEDFRGKVVLLYFWGAW